MGVLLGWSGGVARADLDAAMGDLVEIGRVPAIVSAVMRDHVELTPLSTGPSGLAVRRVGPLTVALGRGTIDALGRPHDGGDGGHVRVPMFGRDPVVVREVHWQRLTLGTLVFDLQRVIACGASLLVTGRREVLRHVLRHQVAEGRTVILATPASTATEHLAIRRGDVPCLHVAAPADATEAHAWLVPWAAMAIADRLRSEGKHVVVAIDDLDAWRPHVRRFPHRGGWQTQLAALASRAYAAEGSVSLIALTREADTARAAAFDGVIDLGAAERGELPLVTTSRVVPPIKIRHKRRLGSAVVAMAQLAQIEPFTATHALDRTMTLQLAQGRRIRECLRLRSIDTLEQVLCLLAVVAHPELPAERIGEFIEAYMLALQPHTESMAAIRRTHVLEPAAEQILLAVAATTLRRMELAARVGAPL